jgi:hypothetical protein
MVSHVLLNVTFDMYYILVADMCVCVCVCVCLCVCLSVCLSLVRNVREGCETKVINR